MPTPSLVERNIIAEAGDGAVDFTATPGVASYFYRIEFLLASVPDTPDDIVITYNNGLGEEYTREIINAALEGKAFIIDDEHFYMPEGAYINVAYANTEEIAYSIQVVVGEVAPA